MATLYGEFFDVLDNLFVDCSCSVVTTVQDRLFQYNLSGYTFYSDYFILSVEDRLSGFVTTSYVTFFGFVNDVINFSVFSGYLVEDIYDNLLLFDYNGYLETFRFSLQFFDNSNLTFFNTITDYHSYYIDYDIFLSYYSNDTFYSVIKFFENYLSVCDYKHEFNFDLHYDSVLCENITVEDFIYFSDSFYEGLNLFCYLYLFNYVNDYGFDFIDIFYEGLLSKPYFYPYFFGQYSLCDINYLENSIHLRSSFSLNDNVINIFHLYLEDYIYFYDSKYTGSDLYNFHDTIDFNDSIFVFDIDKVSSFVFNFLINYVDNNLQNVLYRENYIDILSFHDRVVDSGLILNYPVSLFTSNTYFLDTNTKVSFFYLFDRFYTSQKFNHSFVDSIVFYDSYSTSGGYVFLDVFDFSEMFDNSFYFKNSVYFVLDSLFLNNDFIKFDYLYNLFIEILFSYGRSSYVNYKDSYSLVFESENNYLLETDDLYFKHDIDSFILLTNLSNLFLYDNSIVFCNYRYTSRDILLLFGYTTYEHISIDSNELLSVLNKFFTTVSHHSGLVIFNNFNIVDNLFSSLISKLSFKDNCVFYDYFYLSEHTRRQSVFTLYSKVNVSLFERIYSIIYFKDNTLASYNLSHVDVLNYYFNLFIVNQNTFKTHFDFNDVLEFNLYSKLVSVLNLHSNFVSNLNTSITLNDLFRLYGKILEFIFSNIFIVFDDIPYISDGGEKSSVFCSVFTFEQNITGMDGIVTALDGIYIFDDSGYEDGSLVLNLYPINNQMEKKVDKVYVGGSGLKTVDVFCDGRKYSYVIDNDGVAKCGKGLIGENIKISVTGNKIDYVTVRLDLLKRFKYV